MRGVAIVMMVIYHFMWDLFFFGFVAFETLIGPFWKYFQRTTANSFIILVGVSLAISHLAYQRREKSGKDKVAQKKRKPIPLWKDFRRWGWGLIVPSAIIVALISTPLQRTIAILYLIILGVAYVAYPPTLGPLNFRQKARKGKSAKTMAQSEFGKTLWRGLQIFGWGMVVSTSVLLAGTGTVDFGVLHLIGFSIIASYPFLRFRWINVALWFLFNVVGYYLIPARADDLWLVWLGWRPDRYFAVDYFPLFPWFGVVLLGIAIANFLYDTNGRKFTLPDLSHWFPPNALQWLGKRSLFIYLIHQPLLFVLVFILVQLGIIAP